MPFMVGCDFVIWSTIWRIYYRRRDPDNYRLTISWDWTLSDYHNSMILHMKENLWPELTLQSILRAIQLHKKQRFHPSFREWLDSDVDLHRIPKYRDNNILKHFLSLLLEWENLES